MVVIALFASAICWLGSECCSRMPSMQPAKMTHMTCTARKTKVMVDPVQPRSRPMARAPAERVAHAPSPRHLVLGRGPDRRGSPVALLGVHMARQGWAKQCAGRCTILRATQAFQALRLIFLQLEQDVPAKQ